MTKSQAWIEAIRPRTLPLSLSGILFGSAIAFQNGFIDWTIFALALSTTILFQILSNLANDYGDGVKGIDNADRIGPTRAIQSGVISKNEMKTAVILTSILSFIAAGALIYVGAQTMSSTIIWFYVILAVLCVVAAITYTVGKKAYGYHGMGDIMVFTFFGLVSVLGVFSLYTNYFDWNNLLPATTIGLLSAAVLNLNNMRDYASDKKAGKNTLVVIIGLEFAKLYHVLLIFGAVATLFVFLTNQNRSIGFIAAIPIVSLAFHVMKVAKVQATKEFDPELKVVSLSTFGIAILYFASIWF